jgi:uncharacterized protein (DUF1800 family)
LCRRAGFGATSAELDTLSAIPTINELVDHIVDDPRNFGIPKLSPSMPGAGKPTSDDRARGTMEKIGQWYLQRMAASSFVPPAGKAGKNSAGALREKMVLFWHGLLVSSMEKPESFNNHPTIAAQHTLFRRLALDDFQTLLTETSRDPGMLIYLDNWLSTADNPNENYARELQELFSVGVGNFNQTDVVAAARAGTGYTLGKKNVYIFDPGIHDNGTKTFNGVAANWDLLDAAGNSGGHGIVQYLCTTRRPDVAKYVGKILWQYFASFTPSATTLNDVVAGFTQSGRLWVPDALKTIFNHPDFWAAPARAGKVKNPVDWTVACIKAFGITKLPHYRNRTDPINENMQPMGMQLFFQPNVFGWWRRPETRWIGFPAFTAKVDILNALLDVALKDRKHPLYTLQTKPSDVATDTVLGWFGIDPTTAGPTRTRAIEMLDSQSSGYWRVRNLAKLIALSPAGQAN